MKKITLISGVFDLAPGKVHWLNGK